MLSENLKRRLLINFPITGFLIGYSTPADQLRLNSDKRRIKVEYSSNKGHKDISRDNVQDL